MSQTYYDRNGITIVHGDCRDVLPHLPPSTVALLLTDPPYGIDMDTRYQMRFTAAPSAWWKNADRSTVVQHAPVEGDKEPFDPSPLLAYRKLILWGGNCYADKLPPSSGWLVWDKRLGVEQADWPMGDGEVAWTNIGHSVRIFRHRWFGMLRSSEQGQHWHPTQKPAALMVWCLQYAKLKPGDLVLDPYMGSGPVAVACQRLGLRYVGVEKVEDYCRIAAERLLQSAMLMESE